MVSKLILQSDIFISRESAEPTLSTPTDLIGHGIQFGHPLEREQKLTLVDMQGIPKSVQRKSGSGLTDALSLLNTTRYGLHSKGGAFFARSRDVPHPKVQDQCEVRAFAIWQKAADLHLFHRHTQRVATLYLVRPTPPKPMLKDLPHLVGDRHISPKIKFSVEIKR